MIEHPAPQNTPEWDAAHLGILTSRHAARLVTPTWKPSKAQTVEKLIAELVAEHVTGQPWSEWGGSAYTERGERLEPEALAYYGALRDVEMRSPGLIYRDESRLVGTSPDCVTSTSHGMRIPTEGQSCPWGVLESKSPGAPKHISNVLYCLAGKVPPDHAHQCQWHLWVTGAAWCDFLSYHDEIPHQGLVRVEPIEEAFKAFDAAVPEFCERLLEARRVFEQ